MSLQMFIKGKQIAKEKIKKVVKLGFQFLKNPKHGLPNNHFSKQTFPLSKEGGFLGTYFEVNALMIKKAFCFT